MSDCRETARGGGGVWLDRWIGSPTWQSAGRVDTLTQWKSMDTSIPSVKRSFLEGAKRALHIIYY